MGAIILSVVIITVWTRTAYQNFGYLAGQAAPAEFTQLVVYKGQRRDLRTRANAAAMVHSELISAIDSVKCYHGGEECVTRSAESR